MQNNENAGGVAILVKSFEQKTRIEIRRGERDNIYILKDCYTSFFTSSDVFRWIQQLFHIISWLQIVALAFPSLQIDALSTDISNYHGGLLRPRPGRSRAVMSPGGIFRGASMTPPILACLTHCFDLDKRWLV